MINGEDIKIISFGETFGDLGIIYNSPRSASVFALEKCHLVKMSRKAFKQVMKDISQHYE